MGAGGCRAGVLDSGPRASVPETSAAVGQNASTRSVLRPNHGTDTLREPVSGLKAGFPKCSHLLREKSPTPTACDLHAPSVGVQVSQWDSRGGSWPSQPQQRSTQDREPQRLHGGQGGPHTGLPPRTLPPPPLTKRKESPAPNESVTSASRLAFADQWGRLVSPTKKGNRWTDT